MKLKFPRFITNHLGVKIVSVLVALVLWLVVLQSRNVEITKEIPINIITSEDLVPANEVPTKVSFQLSGPKAFLRAILDRPDPAIKVNLMGSKPGLVTYRFFSDNIRVPIGVKVVSVQPQTMLIRLEKVKKKTVPIKMTFRGQLPEGFEIGEKKVEPSRVQIKGPRSKVNEIQELYTTPIDLAEQVESFTKEAHFELGGMGVDLVGKKPLVSVKVVPVISKYRIRNVPLKIISKREYFTRQKTITVHVRAAANRLKDLSTSDIFVKINLKDKAPGRYRRSVEVELPEGVELVEVIPKKVLIRVK